MNTLGKVRKPVHNKCFGIEIECLTKTRITNQFMGFWYAGGDTSITRESLSYEYAPWEFVSQPLPYEMLVKQVDHLAKRIGTWEVNKSCGIHVHVSRGAVSLKNLMRLAHEMAYSLNNEQIKELFGRPPTRYCINFFDRTERRCAINFTKEETIEFRMFASGDAAWAKECLRRTRLLCGYKGKVTFENLLDLFTKPEN